MHKVEVMHLRPSERQMRQEDEAVRLAEHCPILIVNHSSSTKTIRTSKSLPPFDIQPILILQ